MTKQHYVKDNKFIINYKDKEYIITAYPTLVRKYLVKAKNEKNAWKKYINDEYVRYNDDYEYLDEDGLEPEIEVKNER